ncbi:MAG TPA: hypothetical protein VFJ14_11345, partial [Nocardioidaceae bacterium]|nr:hypothetical protein [Nocardioidaceae bacterium]
PMSLQDADALIRSGTVLDLAALADDDAVVRAATLREVADRLDTWEFPPGSDALEPMYRLVTALRSEAAALAAVSAAPAPEAADR